MFVNEKKLLDFWCSGCVASSDEVAVALAFALGVISFWSVNLSAW